MTRQKKRRSFVSQYEPAEERESKTERLQDNTSYESRKKRAMDKKKKHKSVYQKALETEKTDSSDQAEQSTRPKGGRLAEKIRQLNRDNPDQT